MNLPTVSRFVDLLSLRTLALVLGAWLVVAPPQVQPLQWLDQALFSSGLALTPERVNYRTTQSEMPSGYWRDWWQTETDPWAEHNQLLVSIHYPEVSGQYQTPWWFYPGHSALALVLLLYLLWLVPRISMTAAILGSGLVFFILIVTQLGAQITRGYWLPLGLAAQYLWLGLALIGGHWLQRRWYRQTQMLQQQLSSERMNAGYWQGALNALRPCVTSNSVLGQLYAQGREHQRHKRTKDALACYRELRRRKPGYRDVPERIKAMERPAPNPAHTLAQTQKLEEFAIPKQLGRYLIEHELGRGAMGVVYLGRDPHIARQVAIKTLNVAPFEESERDALKARFFREAEAAGRLRHPNIVTVYDVGQEDELAFIAMDYIQGEPLSRHIAKERLLPAKKTYQLMAEVAGALAYAHRQHIVHRDIKPGNILYDPEQNRVVVTDFGIARVANSARTQTGEILGSPLYMSPEQLKGSRVGQGSDIFSLGVTFYQLLTGAVPFEGDTLAQLSYQIVQSRHRPLRDHRQDLPKSAARIVNKALQKDPAKRYTNGEEMAKALRSALAKDF